MRTSTEKKEEEENDVSYVYRYRRIESSVSKKRAKMPYLRVSLHPTGWMDTEKKIGRIKT
jgi:hypothetical protein